MPGAPIVAMPLAPFVASFWSSSCRQAVLMQNALKSEREKLRRQVPCRAVLGPSPGALGQVGDA